MRTARGGGRGAVFLVAGLIAVSGWLGGAPPAEAAGCTGGVGPDFNGDGVADTLASDPEATVDGVARAGAVHVVFGGGKGALEVSQAMPAMKAAPERGDQFGFARTWTDLDRDGCSDLIVGVPYEDIEKDGKTLRDAGAVYVVYGAPSGMGSRVAEYNQSRYDSGTATEEYDRFGFAVEAGETSGGEPFLVIGVPGENVTSGGKDYADAGCIHYEVGGTRYTVNQDDTGVPGVVEAHDRFGYSLTSTNRFFAVGAPGETIGEGAAFAGAATVFSHTVANGVPRGLVGLDQGDLGAGLSGEAEAGDALGTSLDMAPYRPADQTYNSDALLAIGAPGEAIGSVAGAGSAHVVRVRPDGTYQETLAVDAERENVEGVAKQGDHFGQRVALANTGTDAVTQPNAVWLAVGVPGREVSTKKDAGAVHLFRPLDAAAGTRDRVLTLGAADGPLPGPAEAADYTGASLTSGGANLWVGVPYSKASGSAKGLLLQVPWSVLETSAAGSVRVFKPGQDGVADTGRTFGAVG
ncbi:integrin alpha [Streptomyces sp. NA13]|uniref:integrin alpha n=1 Tax=Streptomyces sp. NA13 TaxID=2996051 RepID=UPI002271289D|nr:integrin alpha [Streptomyces sp. NA13]WAC96571.1 integrin alpha [Streptomyces sp. NA13]